MIVLLKRPRAITRNRVKLGMRVARGEGWKWGSQDCGSDGKPTPGVIVMYGSSLIYKTIEGPGSPESADWVRVKWDCGRENNYRVWPVQDLVRSTIVKN